MSYPTRSFEIVASSGESPVWVCRPLVLRAGSEYSVNVVCPDLCRKMGVAMTLDVVMTINKVDTVVASCTLNENRLHWDHRSGTLVFPSQKYVDTLQSMFLAASVVSGTTKVPVSMNESGYSARVLVKSVSGVELTMNVGVVLANLG